MRRIVAACLALLVCGGLLALLAPPAGAVPSYARRYDIACSGCHTTWGALNAGGLTFRLSGYRRINGRELQPTVKDVELAKGALSIPSTLPLSIISTFGFDFESVDRKASDGSTSHRTGSSLDLDDISIFVSSPLGKHLSVFAEFPMYETKFGEFPPVGPAEAEDTRTRGNIQFPTENPTFEVAKAWWNSLLPESVAPPDSLNLLVGVTHLPLAYASGKVRLSVNQYAVYERRALELISPKKLDELLSEDEQNRLFRLSEPQILVELNGYLVPFGKPTDLGPPETFWLEYHFGITNGSNSKADANTQKDLYGRFTARWWGQTVGVFGFWSPDTYDDSLRTNASIANDGIMSGRQASNSSYRVGPDFTLSLAPFGIPVYLENDFLYGRESDPTGFKKSFSWWGGFSQLNWRIYQPLIAYARYDWIRGKQFDDTSTGGITVAKPREDSATFGLQYLVLENVKLVGEYRRREFQNSLSAPGHQRITDNSFTLRGSVGF